MRNAERAIAIVASEYSLDRAAGVNPESSLQRTSAVAAGMSAY